jgi:hypothetical protein
MMLRKCLDGSMMPIQSGDVMPKGRCQPPVAARELAEQLSYDELLRIVNLTAIWAPEIFELGLECVSERRVVAADVHRELRLAEALPSGDLTAHG